MAFPSCNTSSAASERSHTLARVPADQLLDSVAMRFPDIMVTEKELSAVMSSVGPNMLAKVVDWTATIDDRQVPATIGFFVELASDQGIASRVYFSFTSRSHATLFCSPRWTSLPSPRSRTGAGACARRAVANKREYRFLPRKRLFRQTDHPARPPWDI